MACRPTVSTSWLSTGPTREKAPATADAGPEGATKYLSKGLSGPLDADGWPADSVDLGEPCPVCGSLAKWWDSWGTEHCQRCERATLDRAHALAEWAASVRAGRGRGP